LAGGLPRPPGATKAGVAALFKKTDTSFIRNTADRFRFESLQNRFYKFIELWERQMTNRELGRPVMGAKRSQPPPAAKAPEKEGEAAKAGQPAKAGEHATAAAGASARAKDSGRSVRRIMPPAVR